MIRHHSNHIPTRNSVLLPNLKMLRFFLAPLNGHKKICKFCLGPVGPLFPRDLLGGLSERDKFLFFAFAPQSLVSEFDRLFRSATQQIKGGGNGVVELDD